MNAQLGLRAAMLAILSLLVAACGSRGVSSYEPGVYKGARDEMLEMHAKPEQKERLRERFTKGQADR